MCIRDSFPALPAGFASFVAVGFAVVASFAGFEAGGAAEEIAGFVENFVVLPADFASFVAAGFAGSPAAGPGSAEPSSEIYL